MNYLHVKRRKKSNGTIFIISGIILLFVLFSYLGVFKNLSSFFGKVSRPVWVAKENAGENIKTYKGIFASKRNLVAENEELKKQINDLEYKMSNYETLVDENNSLKEAFGRMGEEQRILAGILVKPAQSLYDTIVIDAGSRDGVALGKKVFAGGTIVLGYISEVNVGTSKVTMYSSADEKVQVVITGKDISTEAIGRGGGTFEMTFPRDEDFPKGTEVVLPGINSHLLGLVDEIISDPRDPLQKVLLRSPVNIQELKFVEVEK